MERTGNMPNNLKKQNSNRDNHQIIRDNRFSRGTIREEIFLIFSNLCLGDLSGTGRSRQVKFRGEDYYAELHLDLTDAFKTHKQTLTVNGKNIRITIPAGIENGQTIKITGTWRTWNKWRAQW